jgi:hypothetical protein
MHPMVEILENMMHCNGFEVEHVDRLAALVRRRAGRDYVKVKFIASADTEWTVSMAHK